MTEPMRDDQTFRLEEYRTLRKEVEIYLAESRSQERYTLIAVGVIWGWLIVNRLSNSLLWAVPITLTLATSLRMGAILLHFGHLSEYIYSLEEKFKAPGWEHKDKGWTLGAAYVLIDLLLLVLTIVAWAHRTDLTKLPCPICRP
jgi:hypothetical protein